MPIPDLQAQSNDAHLDADIDDSYHQNYKRFVKWVDAQGDAAPNENGLYITRTNVDLYFSRAIPTFAGNQNTISRHWWALQWYADYREYVGSDTTFTVYIVMSCRRE